MDVSAILSERRQSRLVDLAKRLKRIDCAVRYHPIYYNKALRIAAEFEAADLRERRRLSQELERRIADRAARTEYGRRFGNWPILEKSTLRDNPRAFRASGGLAIPAGTGGTTGIPIKLWRSAECVAAERAFIDRMLAKSRLSFRTSRIAVLRGDDVKHPGDEAPPYGVFRHGGRRLLLSTPHLSRNTIHWFVEALQSFQPEMLWVYPGPLANFIRLTAEAGLNLKIPFVVSSSEVMPSGTAEAAREVLSAAVIDYYGLAERSCFAFSFRPKEYWFSPAYGKVELVPDEEKPALNDAGRYRIVATGYWNTAMPLMRYDTGDHALLPSNSTAAELEEIALGLKPFFGIEGRSNDFIAAPGGKRISALDHIARGVGNVLRLQIVQNRATAVTIKVLGKPGFDTSDYEKVLGNARLKFPPSIDVSVTLVDRLETLPNGKTPYVIKHGSL